MPVGKTRTVSKQDSVSRVRMMGKQQLGRLIYFLREEKLYSSAMGPLHKTATLKSRGKALFFEVSKNCSVLQRIRMFLCLEKKHEEKQSFMFTRCPNKQPGRIHLFTPFVSPHYFSSPDQFFFGSAIFQPFSHHASRINVKRKWKIQGGTDSILFTNHLFRFFSTGNIKSRYYFHSSISW